MVMHTFYTPIKALVLEYLHYHKEVTELDLATRLKIHPKEIRAILQEMKRNKFIKECYRREQSVSYYSFDEHMFINVVRYRLICMRTSIENSQQQQNDQQPSFNCEQCAERFTGNEILRLYNALKDEFICLYCGGVILEDTTAKVNIDFNARSGSRDGHLNRKIFVRQ
jgi:transcription initiation factor IIE alpha subunit